MVPSESLKDITWSRERSQKARNSRLLETNFSNRKYAGKSDKIHLSYIWHLLGLRYLHRTYSLTLRWSGFNLPSMSLAFRLCFLPLELSSAFGSSSAMNQRRITLITVTESVNTSLFSSPLQSLGHVCVASLWRTKLPQGTQTQFIRYWSSQIPFLHQPG